jgi:hypothetical protein
MKTKRFIISDGQLEEVGPFAAFYHIEAINKTEAAKKLLSFAARAIENVPVFKVKNGAWQLSYVLPEHTQVDAGVLGRDIPLCSSSVKVGEKVKDSDGSFSYYYSEEYTNCK